MKNIAVVTGTSTGLGEAIAIQLAEQGFITYATMRNTAKASAKLHALAEQGKIFIEAMDVQSTESVNQCIEQVIEQHGQIDVLINNAGAGFVRTTEQATEEEVNWVMDVNFHGVVRTTKAVLPYMRKARTGQVINISSVGGLVGQPFNEFYCAAKFAVEGYTESLASYVQQEFGIQFTLVEPGGISSEFANNALAQFQQGGGMFDDEYKPILERYIGGRQTRQDDAKAASVFQTSEQVASVVLDCVNSETPPLRVRTSDWSEAFTKFKTEADPTGTLSRDLANKMIN